MKQLLAIKYLYLFAEAVEDYGLDAKVILKTVLKKIEDQEVYCNGNHCIKTLILDLKDRITMGIDECRKDDDES